MGICLDTEANVSAQDADEAGRVDDWKGGGAGSRSAAALRTPENGNFPMQNGGKVKFDPPKVPVVFVLGGPGSGKVTHCDTLMHEKRGVTHINMMDLLQQYAIGNEMQDFSQLSSKTVTEVLMLEMKMAPAAKAYLVSGYPRSMRDVVEYQEKIQVVNGVILISWRQAVLQKQIDYGAKLGHVVLSLAKMELDNFFKNVMPVADYFDQSDLLLAVNGERSPSEVYKDFRAAVLEVLSAQNNREAELNGVAGMGRGIDDIPGSIVSVDTAPSQSKVVTDQPIAASRVETRKDDSKLRSNEIHSVMGQNLAQNNHSEVNSITSKRIPPIVFVIGGPGSNKATLCLKAVGINPGWAHLSIGRHLRTLADTAPKPNTENFSIKESITAGEFVQQSIIDRNLETQLNQMRGKKGVLVDGHPRNMDQIRRFEEKYQQKPHIILLDCSKLQLGRGRLDDTVSSFRRRLELFREMTLPMLKQMDTDGRLTIVDGDTDSPSVQREFEKVVKQATQRSVEQALARDQVKTPNNGRNYENLMPGQLFDPSERKQKVVEADAVVHDLEDSPVKRAVPSISHHVSLANGHINKPNGNIQNGYGPTNQNGHIPNGKPYFRNILDEADNFPIDSHM